MFGLLGDDRYGLDARGTGADDGDPLAGEIDFLVRPSASVVDRSIECIDIPEFRKIVPV